MNWAVPQGVGAPPAALASGRGRGAARAYQLMWPYLYLAPAFVFLAAFSYYPIVWTAHTSLLAWSLASPVREFVGARHFLRLAADPLFWKVVRNTLIFVGGTAPAAVALALLMAVWTRRGTLGSGVLRTLFFYPTMLPLIGAAAIWLFIFIPAYGLVDHYLGFAGLDAANWLGDPRLALPALMGMTVWKYAGYYMIFFLAGLQSVPGEIYEAGRLEGAVGWPEFRFLTLPLLTPTLLFTGIIALINGVLAVDQVWVMTSGGPDNATNVLLFFIYQTGFAYWDIGRAAALSLLLLAALIALAVCGFRVLERRVHYGE